MLPLALGLALALAAVAPGPALGVLLCCWAFHVGRPTR
jgi:hypothetical protein